MHPAPPIYRYEADGTVLQCAMCAEGKYQLDNRCRKCPVSATCAPGTSLGTIRLQSAMWRGSGRSEILYKCKGFGEGSACAGGNASGGPLGSGYCKRGHEGPLCEVCTEDGHFFKPRSGHCVGCPRIGSTLTFVGIVLGATLGAIGLVMGITHYVLPRSRHEAMIRGWARQLHVLIFSELRASDWISHHVLSACPFHI